MEKILKVLGSLPASRILMYGGGAMLAFGVVGSIAGVDVGIEGEMENLIFRVILMAFGTLFVLLGSYFAFYKAKKDAEKADAERKRKK